MDWHAAKKDERRMLRRIVALLFFFAWLARLSCALPRSARGHVLSVLLRAEARAREFVVGMALDHGVPPPACLVIPVLHHGDSLADAMRLAQNFRALAVLLDMLADMNCASRNCRATRAADLLTVISRRLTGAEAQRFRAVETHLAVERIDSS